MVFLLFTLGLKLEREKMIMKSIRTFASLLAVVFSLSAFNLAQTAPNKNFPNVKIKNFGQMDERYYRGAQPKQDDYQALKALGVQTVIDLREDPVDYAKPTVESLGMRYVNIPMEDGNYPKAEHIEAFLKLVNDPETGVFFAHCKGGKHRTGVTGAVYRFTKYGWDYEQAYREMKNYRFYSSWGYGDMKDFVADYFEKFKDAQAKSTITEKAVEAGGASATETQNK
jgi:protein tyrosine/serine phosphatase